MPNKPPTHKIPGASQRRDGDRAYDHGRRKKDPRLKRAKAFRSSSQWQQIRAIQLRRRPNCEHCRARGLIVPAAQVDHIQPLHLRPDLGARIDNLQSLCTACHAAKSASERKA